MWCEVCIFFFSSRRRHTRYWRDWSSDVCSSDLGADRTVAVVARATSQQTAEGLVCSSVQETDASGLMLVVVRCLGAVPTLLRSEERRVGKECRSRWSPDH